MKDRLSGQKVVILGAARQGLALARYLAGKGAQVTLNDQRPAERLHTEMEALAGLPVSWVCGGHPFELLEGIDCLYVSGGVPLTLPLVAEARRRDIPLSNDSQLFLEMVPCKVIGITGSAGKTTTTTLVGRMAEVGVGTQAKAWMGGNIGTPLLSVVDEIQPEDLAVMELSSFQLELMTRSPQVAAVLNVTPNHLDRHGSMEAYTAAKAQILENQGQQDTAVLGRDDSGAWGLANRARGRLLSFGMGELPEGGEGAYVTGEALRMRLHSDDAAKDLDRQVLSRSEIELRGEHNLLNVLAACTVAAAAGLPVEAMQAGVSGFHGVPHRLEFVRTWGGAEWYNDSIATAPERAMAALRSFTEPLVLLAGGRDKNLPWEDFAALARQRVDHLVVFGECSEKVLGAFGLSLKPGVTVGNGSRRPYTIARCSTLEAAVEEAARIVQPGDVVLLSPGGTSFDEFHDFEERGEWYKKWVTQL